MNKKRYYYLLAPAVLLMAGVAMSGCSDRDEAAPQVTAKAGEPILFGIADTQSRTHYTEDKYQIDWDVYDKIGIYSDKAEPGSALLKKRFAYYMINKVFPDTDPEHDYHGAIVPVANRDVVEITEGEDAPSLGGDDKKKYGLMWGDKDTFSEEYTFYGAYPACRITKSPADDSGYFTMEYHTNQTVTVESVSNGVYTTKPDMLNAYMMAEKKIYPREDHILLDFDPIMTTLDIHITAGGYELGTGIINPVTITGVSVMMPGALTNKALRYHVAEGTTGEPQGGDGSATRLSDVNTSQKESVFVGIDNYGKRYVDLFEGESISLLAFLPPMDMKTGVKIKVHAVGALNFEVTVKEEMIRQGRIDIQLPDVKPSSEIEQAALQTNNWISQLDPSIKLDQLSIPGYICTGNETSDDIQTLLRQGVRAFNIEKLTTSDGNNYYINDADINTILKAFMSTTDEFLILWIENGYLAGDDTDSHVDTLARFCSEDTIVYVKCEDESDEHYDELRAMEEEIKAFRQENGEPYRLVPLPMADEVVWEGERLPATYANFLIINGAVLLPFYNSPKDEEARKVLQAVFPDREVIGINCLPLIKQHGSLHCVTMQYPEGYIS